MLIAMQAAFHLGNSAIVDGHRRFKVLSMWASKGSAQQGHLSQADVLNLGLQNCVTALMGLRTLILTDLQTSNEL